jgi:hypothetical protein
MHSSSAPYAVKGLRCASMNGLRPPLTAVAPAL